MVMRQFEHRSPWNYDVDAASESVDFDDPSSLTQQQFADEADINVLVRRFGITGELPVGRDPGEYGDFSDGQDFQEAMENVRQAEELFDALPARIRDRFQNQAGKFLDFIHDPLKMDEARELGLLPKEEAAAVPSVPLEGAGRREAGPGVPVVPGADKVPSGGSAV